MAPKYLVFPENQESRESRSFETRIFPVCVVTCGATIPHITDIGATNLIIFNWL